MTNNLYEISNFINDELSMDNIDNVLNSNINNMILYLYSKYPIDMLKYSLSIKNIIDTKYEYICIEYHKQRREKEEQEAQEAQNYRQQKFLKQSKERTMNMGKNNCY